MGMIIFSWIGWWLGAKIGFWTAYILSGVGSILGVYIGWRINRDYLQ
jgi:dipeptide/tripeptide permease